MELRNTCSFERPCRECEVPCDPHLLQVYQAVQVPCFELSPSFVFAAEVSEFRDAVEFFIGHEPARGGPEGLQDDLLDYWLVFPRSN